MGGLTTQPGPIGRVIMEDSGNTCTCPKCGSIIPAGGRFCGFCGSAAVRGSPATDPHLGQVVAGRYRIKNRIAEGGMAEVYIAEHETLAQRVAVKLLHRRFASDEKLVARFFNEARSHGRVKHPHAVSLLDFGRLHDGTLYLVTEFIEGTSLTDFVQEQERLEPTLAIRLAIQIAEVLSAAHAEQIVHRDLKPDNIIVSEGPGLRYTANVIDFGIAKILDDGEYRLTQTGVVFGTPEYMSPEQAEGIEVNHRTDLYSFGCILFFMLTGHPPFEDSNRARLIQRQIKEPPPMDKVMALDDVSADLVQLVQDCLRKNPDQRPENALDVLARLETLTPTIVDAEVKRRHQPMSSPATGAGTPALRGESQDDTVVEADTLEVTTPQHAPSHSDWGGLPGPSADEKNRLEPELEFTFEPHSQIVEEDAYTWGGEDESPMGQVLDVAPTEFSADNLKRSRIPLLSLLIAVLLLGGGATGYFLIWVPSRQGTAKTTGLDDASVEVPAGTGEVSASIASVLEQTATPPDGTEPTPTSETSEVATDTMLGQESGGPGIGQASVAPEALPNRPFELIHAAHHAGLAASLLSQAEVDSASEQWDLARQLLQVESDAAVDVQVSRDIERAQELIRRAEAELRRNRCRRADEAIVEMRQISPALRRRYLGPLNECNRRRTEPTGRPPRSLE